MSSSIPGDPVGMRAKAARLHAQADEIHTWADRIDREVDGMEFGGPAARRIRHQMKDWKAAAMQSATELLDLSHLLLRSAGDVETRQAAETRRLAQQKGHK
jgi:uncharacterized protein YukE